MSRELVELNASAANVLLNVKGGELRQKEQLQDERRRVSSSRQNLLLFGSLLLILGFGFWQYGDLLETDSEGLGLQLDPNRPFFRWGIEEPDLQDLEGASPNSHTAGNTLKSDKVTTAHRTLLHPAFGGVLRHRAAEKAQAEANKTKREAEKVAAMSAEEKAVALAKYAQKVAAMSAEEKAVALAKLSDDERGALEEALVALEKAALGLMSEEEKAAALAVMSPEQKAVALAAASSYPQRRHHYSPPDLQDYVWARRAHRSTSPQYVCSLHVLMTLILLVMLYLLMPALLSKLAARRQEAALRSLEKELDAAEAQRPTNHEPQRQSTGGNKEAKKKKSKKRHKKPRGNSESQVGMERGPSPQDGSLRQGANLELQAVEEVIQMLEAAIDLGTDVKTLKDVIQAGEQLTHSLAAAGTPLEAVLEIAKTRLVAARAEEKEAELAALDAKALRQATKAQLAHNSTSVDVPVASQAKQDKCEMIEPQISDDDLRLCVVCLEAPREMIFVPCGHVHACRQCADRLSECPTCRANIERRYRAFT